MKINYIKLNSLVNEIGGQMKLAGNKNYLLMTLLTILFFLFFSGCNDPAAIELNPYEYTELFSKPSAPIMEASKGYSRLGIENGRDGYIFIPEQYNRNKSLPLLVLLHGSGGMADNWEGFNEWADSNGVILLAVDSRERTWDFILGDYGPDVKFIDKALKYTFDRCTIDQNKIGLVGFSDGASYALSLGASNGHLFSHLIAYSPGFYDRNYPLRGKPKVFISHGTKDEVLPIYATKEQVLKQFLDMGYDVRFEEFDGGHEVPGHILTLSLENWFLEK